MASKFDKVINIEIQGEEGIENLQIELGKSSKTVSELESHIELLNKAIKGVDKNSDSFKVLQKEIQKADGELKDINSSLEGVSSVQKAEGFFKLGEAMGGAFQVGVVGAQLFGESAEEIEKAQLQLLQVISALDGIKKISEGLSKENLNFVKSLFAVQSGLGKATVGAKIFGVSVRSALIATGIGALIVGVGLLITYWDDVVAAVDKSGETFAGVKAAFVPGLKLIGGLVFDYLVTPWKTFFALVKETADFLTGGEFNGEEIAKPFLDAKKRAEDNFKEIGNSYEKGVRDKILSDNLEILKSNEKLYTGLREQQARLYDLEINNEKNSLEARKKALADKLSNSLKGFDAQKKILEDTRELNGTLTEEEKIQFAKLTVDKIAAEKEYVKAIEALNKGEADKRKANQDKILEQLEKNYAARLNVIKKNELQGLITEEEFNKESDSLELEKLDARKKLLQKFGRDTIEAEGLVLDKKLEIQKEFSSATKKLIADENSLDDFRTEVKLKNLNKQLTAEQLAVEDKKSLIYQIRDVELEAIDDTEAEKLSVLKEGTAEFKLVQEQAAQARIELENSTNEQIIALDKETADKRKEIQAAQLAFVQNAVSQTLSVVQQAADLAVLGIENTISALDEQIERQNENVDAQNERYAESVSKIDEIESQLSEARGARYENLIAQRDEERKKAAQAQKAAEQEAKKAKALEDKKIEEEKKAARIRKGLAIASAIVNTGLAITQILAAPTAPFIEPFATVVRGVQIGIAAAAGAVQIATISSQKFAQGGIVDGKSHSEGGVPVLGGRAELEGGEAVINKNSTAMFKPILSALNVAGGGKPFAEGGILANFSGLNTTTDNTQLLAEVKALRESQEAVADRPVYVSVTEINSVNDNVKAIQNSATL